MPLPTSVESLKRPTARDLAFEQLRGWIEQGVLGPGEVIKDQEVAASLGVSRTPVREALQLLEQQGAVEKISGRVTRVVDASFDDVRQVYAPLAALQAVAAELGTPKATRDDIAEMTTHNERLLTAVKASDPATASAEDHAFHGVLVRCAGNRYLNSSVEPLLMHIRRLEGLYFKQLQLARASYDEHRRIIDAVAGGDVEAATEMTRRNFHRVWKP